MATLYERAQGEAMQNIDSLNTSRIITADMLKSKKQSTIQFTNINAYPINDGGNCVLIYQNRVVQGKPDANNWVVKYDVKNNHELWAYQTPVGSSVSSLTENGVWGLYQYEPNRIQIIDKQFFIDTYSGKAQIRSIATGEVVHHDLFGSDRKICLIAKDNYILLWNAKGFLECYHNLSLKWKQPLTSEPESACLHPEVGFTVFTNNSGQVQLYSLTDGKHSFMRLQGVYNRHQWCETDTGFITLNSSGLYELDVRTGHCTLYERLPQIHWALSVIRTNKNYIIAQVCVGSGINYGQRYVVYDVSSHKRVAMMRCTEYDTTDIIGIGNQSVLLTHLENRNTSVSPTIPAAPQVSYNTHLTHITGILDIKGKSISYPMTINVGKYDRIVPFGKNRIISCHETSLSIIG